MGTTDLEYRIITTRVVYQVIKGVMGEMVLQSQVWRDLKISSHASTGGQGKVTDRVSREQT